MPHRATPEGSAMYCMRCGQQLPDDANFCLKCGLAQRSDAIAAMRVAEPRWEKGRDHF
jgi:predicted amidophosphoribosyltransferase